MGYPVLEVDKAKLKVNADAVLRLCSGAGIAVTGVVKGAGGDPVCADIMARAGCSSIATSRIDQLVNLRNAGSRVPLMLVRIPMKSEAAVLVRNADISLNSDIGVLRAINAEAGNADLRHGVVLMIDLGDLREGIWTEDEYISVAGEVEDGLHHLDLLGVGVNLGCYGSILPTREKLGELVSAAEKIEARIGRRLEIISGGASTSLPLVQKGQMPERVNHLRIGEAILINKDNEDLHDSPIEGTFRDVFTLKAEIVESRVKPTHPVGEIGFDAFRGKPVYEDRGDRGRAIAAVGKLDYGYIDQIIPRAAGAAVIGASSDHTILDIEDSAEDIKSGYIMSFDLNYAAVAFLSKAPGALKAYV